MIDGLDALGIVAGTDKGSICHGYLRHYARILAPFRDMQVNLLEIGVFRGASLKTWANYFSCAQIIGADILEECRQYAADRVTVEIGSQIDPEFLRYLGETYRPSVIIDDGSHQADHVMFTFSHLFKYLQPGCIYIVEDVHFHAGSSAFRHRGSAEESPQAYFLRLANLTVCAADTVEFDRQIAHMVDGIEFFHGAIAIRKKAIRDADFLVQCRRLVERGNTAALWAHLAGMIVRMHGDSEESLECIDRAFSLEPSVNYLLQKANILENINRLGAAIEIAEEAVRFAPAYRPAQDLLNRLRAAANVRP